MSLADNWCEECGRAKSYRLWPGVLTGCKACDEVVTRHRCTGRPDLDSLDIGTSWTCPDCGTAWAVTEEGIWCPECGCHECRTEKRWTVSVPGDRIETAPRYRPPPWTPLRNVLHQMAEVATSRPAVSPANNRYPRGPLGSCYRMASGSMVHVRPGCRC